MMIAALMVVAVTASAQRSPGDQTLKPFVGFNLANFAGDINDNSYDVLVDEQIKLNANISDIKNEHLMLLQSVDDLHARKHDIENTIANNQRLRNDYNNMIQLRDELNNKISNIIVESIVDDSSSYY